MVNIIGGDLSMHGEGMLHGLLKCCLAFLSEERTWMKASVLGGF